MIDIGQHEPHNKMGMNSGAPEEWPVTALLVTPVILILFTSDDTSWLRKEWDCIYDKLNKYVVICDTDILYRLTNS